MKKLHLVMILILFSIICNSQSLVRENKLWSNTEIGSEVGSECKSYWIKFQEDTLINNTTYKKILRSDDYNHENWYADGFIREDSTQKVYTYHPEVNEEFLLYDFSLEKNDTFFYTSPYDYWIVDSVVYEPFGNSEDTVKQIHIGDAIWIEGIGSNQGIFELFVPTGAYTNLVCYFENDELVYHNPKFDKCFPSDIHSQSIFPKDQVWSIMHGPGDTGDCGNLYCYSYFNKLAEDTLINEEVYSRVMESTDSLMNEWSLVGFMREENQKVYFRKKDAQTDCLLYDFGCSVGDTLNLNCWCPESETKFEVDSIKYLPVMGVQRKHIYLSYLNNNSTEVWIENIGSTSGFLNGGGRGNCMTGFHEKLLCCTKPEVKIYQDAEYEGCYLGPGIINSLQKNDMIKELIKVYPNPANGYINITAINSTIRNIELFDLTGNCLFQNCVVENQNFTLNTNGFPPGVYLLKVETDEEQVVRKVLIN